MRYHNIDQFEVINGKYSGISLFVQGCPIHCKGCFNQETWDFNSGNEWTEEVESKFLHLANKPYIKRISILGGEPLAEQNVDSVYNLIIKIRDLYPDKKIWLYSGYTIEQIKTDTKKYKCFSNADYAVINPFIQELKNLSLEFRGSENQEIVDVRKYLNGTT